MNTFKTALYAISFLIISLIHISHAGESIRPYVKIAIIGSGGAGVVYDRLHSLGFIQSEIISKHSTAEIFSAYDMVYLPASWASSAGDPDTILALAEEYKQYVNQGGGLLVEQPNPHQYDNGTINVTLLPVPVTFTKSYNQNDFPCTIVDTTHYLTQGLSRYDMPFPADQVEDLDYVQYHVLSRGSYTQTPSMFVMEYGSGRILVETTTASTGGYGLADTMLVRIVSWLTPNVNSIQETENRTPEKFTLYQNYPNPFNGMTHIDYTLQQNSDVEITVYDILGKRLKQFPIGPRSTGRHSFRFNAHGLPSGIYYYELKTSSGKQINKMTYIK